MSENDIQTVKAIDATPDLVESIVVGQLDVWPVLIPRRDEFLEMYQKEGKEYQGEARQAPVYFAAKENDRVVGFTRTFLRTIKTPDGSLPVMALSAVWVSETQRGKNLGHELVDKAFDRVRNGDFPVSLFQTRPPIKPFYDRFGCQVVKNPFINSKADTPNESPWHDEVIMRFPGDGPWPEGTIDLMGVGY